jgi:ankyrin repeat protein
MANAHRELLDAVSTGDIARAKALLEQGADVNGQDGDGLSPLHMAVCRGSREFVELLIDKGADLEITDRHGITPLMCATAGDLDILRLLIDKGASLDDGTALEWAEGLHRLEAAQILGEAPLLRWRCAQEKAAREAEEKRIADLHNTAAKRQDALKNRRPRPPFKPS